MQATDFTTNAELAGLMEDYAAAKVAEYKRARNAKATAGLAALAADPIRRAAREERARVGRIAHQQLRLERGPEYRDKLKANALAQWQAKPEAERLAHLERMKKGRQRVDSPAWRQAVSERSKRYWASMTEEQREAHREEGRANAAKQVAKRMLDRQRALASDINKGQLT